MKEKIVEDIGEEVILRLKELIRILELKSARDKNCKKCTASSTD